MANKYGEQSATVRTTDRDGVSHQTSFFDIIPENGHLYLRESVVRKELTNFEKFALTCLKGV